jgi:hypothetical protein
MIVLDVQTELDVSGNTYQSWLPVNETYSAKKAMMILP